MAHAGMLRSARGAPSSSVPEVPRVKAAYGALEVGTDGRIWIRIATASERYSPPPRRAPDGSILPMLPWREPAVYDVYEPDGSYLGQVRTDSEHRLLAMQGDTVWARVIDPEGVPLLRRFRIRWPVP